MLADELPPDDVDEPEMELPPSDNELIDLTMEAEETSTATKKPAAKRGKQPKKKLYENKRAPMTTKIINATGVTPIPLASLKEMYDPQSLVEPEHFAEIFSPPRLAPEFKKRGLRASMSVDVLMGWDLSKLCVREFVLKQISRRRPKAIMLSPPCTTFSTLQALNMGKMDEQLWKAKVAEGKAFLKFSMELAELQRVNGRFFVFEHPERASSWKDAEVRAMMQKQGVMVANFDQCQYNLRSKEHKDYHKKGTRFLTNSPAVHAEFDMQRCCGGHTHVDIQGQEGGQGRASYSARYPQEMVNALVQALVNDM